MTILFSLNRVELLGRLGADPELKYLPSGQTVCKVRLATEHSYKKNDEWVRETEWSSVVVWGKDADRCGEKLNKGSAFHVISGRLQTRPWDDKDGNKRYTTEIVANEIAFPDGWDGEKRKDEQITEEKQNTKLGEQPAGNEEIPF
jgi:single-strand DNA-binding protein